jgi:hypothetical protein
LKVDTGKAGKKEGVQGELSAGEGFDGRQALLYGLVALAGFPGVLHQGSYLFNEELLLGGLLVKNLGRRGPGLYTDTGDQYIPDHMGMVLWQAVELFDGYLILSVPGAAKA